MIGLRMKMGNNISSAGHGTDSVRFDGLKSEYSIAKTIDGTGYVVWNEKSVDLMWDIEQIEFDDESVELDLIG